MPERSRLPGRKHAARSRLPVHPVQLLHPRLKRMIPGALRRQLTRILPHPPLLPAVARRIVERPQTMHQLVQILPRHVLVRNIPVNPEQLQLRIKAKRLQLVLHQHLIQVRTLRGPLQKLLPDRQTRAAHNHGSGVQSDQIRHQVLLPKPPVAQGQPARGPQPQNRAHAGPRRFRRPRTRHPVLPVPPTLHLRLMLGPPARRRRLQKQPHPQPVPALRAPHRPRPGRQKPDQTRHRIHRRLLQHPVLVNLQRQIALPRQRKRAHQRELVLVQMQPVPLSRRLIRRPGMRRQMRLRIVGMEHPVERSPVVAPHAVAHHPVLGVNLQRHRVPGVPHSPEQVLHRHQRPAPVLRRRDRKVSERSLAAGTGGHRKHLPEPKIPASSKNGRRERL